MSTSECSSGCESGWTAYLDQSSNSANDLYYNAERSKSVTLRDGYEDEDLSMISDASSGPRHDYNHQENENNCVRNYSGSKQGTIRKHEAKIKGKGKFSGDSSYLDDTASSPVLSFSKTKLARSAHQNSHEQETQGFSTTHYKGKSSNQHLGFQKSSVTGLNKSGKQESGSAHLKQLRM
ncbi:protein SOB FIVE-LIKE 5 isoform X1 [Daucus carota subsp. sativus]|uniref:protein SOB FIVE-LIKE 5 isoform X1 n=1 Tax=Daucus carota subsp. sativus TaxID=79200 RepID=UPI0007F046A5|nr:PREDICTED: uncharacterized protein LOC108217826 isoform X1 [Daucus carota subsp. sativus]